MDCSRLARGYGGYDVSGTGGANCPECGWHEPWAKGLPAPPDRSARV